MQLISNYKNFLDSGKTERECVKSIISLAKEQGYKDINDFNSLKAGDKFYITKMNKAIALFQMGTSSLENGMNILGAHIDSPRLDGKQNPIYEKYTTEEINYMARCIETEVYGCDFNA